MKYLLFVCLLIAVFLNTAYTQTIYTNFGDFKAAAKIAKAGDEIILAKGRYKAESISMIDISGTEANPVIIRAEEIGADTLDNGTYFDLRHCSYVTIQGFVINISENSTTFKIQTCDHIRITQNIMDGTGEAEFKADGVSRNSSVWVSIQSLWDDLVGISNHNQIDHNLFQNKHTLGNMIRIDGTDEKFVSQYDVIEYNHFKNMGPRAENEMEVIRVGWSAMSESDGFATISNNLFEECNGDPEIVSVKCNKNIISHNTFRRCQGTLSLRHGNKSVVEGNFFLGENASGTGGVRIYGSDHRIVNNYFEGLTGTLWDAPVTLTKGDAEEGSSGLSNHFRIERAIIANNTLVNNDYGIEIGYDNGGKYSKPPRDVVMVNNLVTGSKNSLVNYISAPANMIWSDNIIFPAGSAIVGTSVSFTTAEAQSIDPQLNFNSGEGLYRSTALTPQYLAFSSLVGEVAYDMDGQLRTTPYTYGADEWSSELILYKPLEAKDVGVSMGEYLFASKSKLDFGVEGGNTEILVSSNLNWTVVNDQSWIKVTPTTGSAGTKLSVEVDENTTGAIRSGNLLIESTNATGDKIVKIVAVNQAASVAPYLQVSTETVNLTAPGEASLITVTSNIQWSATADKVWLIVAPGTGDGNGQISVSALVNESVASRNGSITVTNGAELSRVIKVQQAGKQITEVKLPVVTAIASTEQADQGNIAANVIDNNLNNRWSGDGDGAFITLDLGAICNVSFLKVGLYKGDQRTSSFDILTSTDGVTFTGAITGITSEITADLLVIYDFSNREAQYVRIVGHGNSTGTWNSFTEFEVFGWVVTSLPNNLANMHEIKVYPNPSEGQINIEHAEGVDLQILDSSGRVVYFQNGLTGLEWISTKLGNGLYMLRFTKGDKHKWVKHLVVNNE